MTKGKLIAGVQAHFGNFTPGFETRIESSIPVGIELFGSEAQWESFDRYFQTVSEVDNITGKTRIKLPTNPNDFFKPVHIWTNTRLKVDYIDRQVWAERQIASLTSQPPVGYTQIGGDLFLDRPNSGEVIYMVYTRSFEDMDLPDLPFQYHPAVLLAIVWYLTESVTMVGQQMRDSVKKDRAWQAYQQRVTLAQGMELSVKDRVRMLQPSAQAQKRGRYR